MTSISKTHQTRLPADDLAGTQAQLRSDFANAFARELAQRTDAGSATASMNAAAVAARGLLQRRWAQTQRDDATQSTGRRVHYLSMEFLMGRALNNALAALRLDVDVASVLGQRGPAIAQVLETEADAALGNGGLGRLAACFLDSFATLGLPSFGYGLRYENGMFAQGIQDGRQVEMPDEWLRNGNPWELCRNDVNYNVGFGGVVVNDGGFRRWLPSDRVIAQAFDFIVPGHETERVSTLRQWRAVAAKPIDLSVFCRGDHVGSATHRLKAESLNWVLYPDDSTASGRELRLRQEILLVSASLQDMLARHQREHGDIHHFGLKNAVHLNDTHPALAPAELMRLLLDEYGMDWERAWKIVSQAVSYTNHTLMPEALETWPVQLLQSLLPRHLEIIYEINRLFLDDVRARFPGNTAMVERVSLIDETGERRIRMAALAIVASHKVNGVSALHSQLMTQTIFADYAALWPDRFINITNGVTPRRWLMQANPELSSLLDRHLGIAWRNDLGQLRALDIKATENKLRQEFLTCKLANKTRLSEHIRTQLGVCVDPRSMFDVHIKRIHEYKRQLLNVLHVIARYQAIIADPEAAIVPRTIIFAGKAASAYHAAKQVIRLIHDVARVVNSDPRVGSKLKIVFLPNYGVSLAERIIPAADLSEQISTAGTEASGTGNMKFALNGAITIGTWDGANIEMAEAMGVDNMFVFGLHADAVANMKSLGYDPRLYVEQNLQLSRVIDAIAGGTFSPGEPTCYAGLVDSLLNRDTYMLMADFAGYVAAQSSVDTLYADQEAWATMALRNIAAMGAFSADRAIREYMRMVWAPPLAR